MTDQRLVDVIREAKREWVMADVRTRGNLNEFTAQRLKSKVIWRDDALAAVDSVAVMARVGPGDDGALITRSTVVERIRELGQRASSGEQ